MTNKTNILALVIAAIALSVSISVVLALPDKIDVKVAVPTQLGADGDTNFYTVDAENGFKVDGTEVLDSSRNLSAGTISGSAMTLTGETTVEGFTQGGGVLNISTTNAARTLTQAEMLASNVIEIESTATGAALTLTLPATSTMSTLIGTAGNVREWIIENNHTAAATTTTVAAGTGIDLLEPDGQNVVIGINNTATLKCWRKETTDVGCIVDETIPAD